MARDERHWWRREALAMVVLAYPLVLTNLAQALIATTDVVLLGWAGPHALAAASLGVNLVNACVFFGTGLVTAAAPMIARALGERSNAVRDVRRTVRQALWVSVTLVVPMWLVLWQAEPILLAFGQQPDLAHDAVRLVRPMMLGLLPLMGYYVLRAFVSALERPIWAFIIGAAAVLFNAVLNYALIFGRFGLPPLGLFGAGLGSALSNLWMFVGLAVVVSRHRRFRRYHLFGNWWRADWPRYRALWRLGLPIAVTVGLEVTIFNCAVFLMGLIGAPELAAHAIAIQLAALCFMIPLGLAQAATVRVGLAFGRGDAAGVSRAGRVALAITMAVMACTATILLAFRHPLVALFLASSTPAEAHVVSLAVSFLIVAALFQFFDGAQAVGAGMLRGLHDTFVPMLLALIGYWVVGLGTAVALGFWLGWGGVGVWIGLAAGLGTVAVLMVARWAMRARPAG
ncbi:MATE family efflux transporter [Sphingomonas sp. H39-1-10]|uniref:MATE family efflux transporter n=1 Tax=Sphingomonas pollutisoli TaxID=3030829 RepID=UPI0023B974E8|nr:MATE family efflux transporter [Sphingomonas pollutisoli]MDF0486544.1 MATE family efflux transporter [Sphingomonas pollutisoli]